MRVDGEVFVQFRTAEDVGFGLVGVEEVELRFGVCCVLQDGAEDLQDGGDTCVDVTVRYLNKMMPEQRTYHCLRRPIQFP